MNNEKIKSNFRNTVFISVIFIQLFYCQNGQLNDLDSEHWRFEGNDYEITEHKGKKALKVAEGGFIFAYLEDSRFTDGIIEFKMSVNKKRNFPGINFRIQDNENFENFYIRPHQSGNPDALQYTPVYNGLAAWQLYHGPNYTKAVVFNLDDWIHVKLVVKGSMAEVYLNGQKNPVFLIPKLHRNLKTGMVGFTGEQGFYADFKYTNSDDVILREVSAIDKDLDLNTISDWLVSKTTFNESVMMPSNEIPQILTPDSSWLKQKTDENGLLNLSRVHRLEEGKEMVYVKYIVNSATNKVQEFQFGFNDRVKVFINGKAFYYGDNTFRSRDYRFLGSIGYFDTLYLPLNKGKNEIVIAVAESFGGWGVKAKLIN